MQKLHFRALHGWATLPLERRHHTRAHQVSACRAGRTVYGVPDFGVITVASPFSQFSDVYLPACEQVI